MDYKKYLVSAEEARWTCSPSEFGFTSTADVEPLEGLVGQERAVRSFGFGFGISTQGFNVFAAGPQGTGKHSAVASFVKDRAAAEPTPSDWCYVYNFKFPDKPMAIELTSGTVKNFSKDIDEFVKACRTTIPQAFDSEEYERRKDRILNNFQSKRDALLAHLREYAAGKDFSVELTTAGIITIPIVEGKLMKREEYDKLAGPEKEAIKEKTDQLQQEVNRIMTTIRAADKEAKEELRELDKEITIFAVGHLLNELRERYADNSKITTYLDDMRDDIVENLDTFKSTEKKGGLAIPGLDLMDHEDAFEKYRVNIFVTHENNLGGPVVFESNPTYYNLFGRLEYSARFGAMVTNFTMIKSGALQRANGGYLILNALDVLLNPFSFEALKRALKTQESRIDNIGEQFRVIPVTTLRPEPIPLNVKVVLIGSPYIYDLLYALDEDFRKLFKVKAEFSAEIDRSEENLAKYAALVSSKCRHDNLLHFDATGVARIVEYGVRLSEDKTKLSTRLLELGDLVSEASYWASTNDHRLVSGPDVSRAIKERIKRSNMIEDKIHERFEDGTILVDTEGEVVGQVNGLAIIFLGDYSFGKPSRITSKVYVGKKGVINIERESQMSGQIHDKAVLILSGYLGDRFAGDRPLAMNATIGFEQSYGPVEGDSAASTELYALLSSLSRAPLKQNIAVTGSVNQQGEVQPIGGVNRKIEGFYDVCRVKGLTGTQGVLIPRRNLKNLALREDVVEAIRNGEFRLWAVDTIDEGLEILTGMPAGKILPDGNWEPGTINAKVDARLRELADSMRDFGSPGGLRAA